MTQEELDKLKQLDEIMFELDNKGQLKQAGLIMKDLKMIDDPTDLGNVIKVYNQDLLARMQKAITK